MEDSKYSYVAKFELTFIWILNDRKFHANVKTILIWSAKDTWPQVHFGIFGRHQKVQSKVCHLYSNSRSPPLFQAFHMQGDHLNSKRHSRSQKQKEKTNGLMCIVQAGQEGQISRSNLCQAGRQHALGNQTEFKEPTNQLKRTTKPTN